MNLIKKKRLEKNISRKELAEKVKCSIKMIEAIEQYKRKPGSSLMIRIFKELEIPITEIEFFLNDYTTKCS